jgi:hypothetical protein
MKMTLDDLVWSKHHWERMRDGGIWPMPNASVTMQRTPKGFSLYNVMPFTPEMAAAVDQGWDVPKTAAEFRTYQRRRFNHIKKYVETAGLEFDDPKGLLNKQRKEK